MYILAGIDRKTYTQIETRLHELHPDYNMQMMNCDINLERLGFCESAPCDLYLDINEEQLHSLLDELIEYEVDAFNTDSRYPDYLSPEYKKYEKCTWLFNYLYHLTNDDSNKLSRIIEPRLFRIEN